MVYTLTEQDVQTLKEIAELLPKLKQLLEPKKEGLNLPCGKYKKYTWLIGLDGKDIGMYVGDFYMGSVLENYKVLTQGGRLATNEEICTHLKAIAIEKGMVGGCKVKNVATYTINRNCSPDADIYEWDGQSFRLNGYCIWNKEGWIEIVEEKKIPQEEISACFTLLAREIRGDGSLLENARQAGDDTILLKYAGFDITIKY